MTPLRSGAWLAFAVTALGCHPHPAPYVEKRAPCAEHDPLRKAYYGDLHSHTLLSFDAWTYEVRTTPEQAYSFAQGKTVYLPPLDTNGNPTVPVAIDRPLDFAAVTDHSEYLGETSLCTTPGSAAYNSLTCGEYRPPGNDYTVFGIAFPQFGRDTDVCGGDGKICTQAAGPVWNRIQKAAADAYDVTSACQFTSFVAYEYTLSPLGSNMHRNVIFRTDRVLPEPITFYDAATPLDLWQQLKASCIDGIYGCDVLAIPHNSNLANGNMFLVEYPGAKDIGDQRSQAELRASMEPVVEITQHKGDSECINGLPSNPAAPDELCDYEKLQQPPLNDCGPTGTGFGGFTLKGCVSPTDYVRGALKEGLQQQVSIGVNPLQLGIIGSTDSHNGTPGHVQEKTFNGHLGDSDNTPQKLLTADLLAAHPLLSNPGGLAGVWAEENSRDYLFDSIRRRETFGTSGPRISVRFFGGWGYPAGLCGQADLVSQGYSGGVPMGGVLPKKPAGATAPVFVLSALKDPGTTSAPGMPLQRAQIIKGWVDSQGVSHEQVTDVAGDANNGASVDLSTCTPTGAGSDSLCSVWSDPSFDPTQNAFYYVRVVENPSCRWSTYVCNSLSAADQAAYKCADLGVPKTIQERAWTSPIWYVPGG
jgi:hypothetical protein